jgi:hypothetical protein
MLTRIYPLNLEITAREGRSFCIESCPNTAAGSMECAHYHNRQVMSLSPITMNLWWGIEVCLRVHLALSWCLKRHSRFPSRAIEIMLDVRRRPIDTTIYLLCQVTQRCPERVISASQVIEVAVNAFERIGCRREGLGNLLSTETCAERASSPIWIEWTRPFL